MNQAIQKISKAIIFVFTRAAVFYVVVFLISNAIVDYDKIKFSMQIRALNAIMPMSFAPLVKDIGPGKKISVKALEPYIKFYQRVVDFFPEQADARAMLGFCYFHKGDVSRAIAMYQKAYETSPDTFWINYNLGILYAVTGKDDQAANFLKRAITTKDIDTMNFIVSSTVIYRTLMMDVGMSSVTLLERLKNAKFQAHLLLLIVDDRRKDFADMLATAQKGINAKWPVQEIFLYYAGRASFELNQDKEAADYFQASLEANSQLSESYRQLAATWQRMGRTQAANDALSRSASAQQTVSSVLRTYSFNPQIF